jgi:uncharacterized membrane protein/YHS domain-containing protein
MLRCHYEKIWVAIALLMAGVWIQPVGAAPATVPPTTTKTVVTTTTIPTPPANASLSLAVSTDTHSTVVANPDMMCPVSPDEKADVKFSKVYEGKIYYFSSQKNLDKFNADPKPFVTALESRKALYPAPAAAPQTETTSAPEGTDSSAKPAKADDSSSGDLPIQKKLLRFAGLIHPLLVHFPIALLIMAAIGEFLYNFTGRHFFGPISIFTIRFGSLFALLAALTGWLLASGGSGPEDTAWILNWHRWLGIGTAVSSVLVSIMSFWITENSDRSVYRWLLYLTAALVAVTGHFGGMLVFGADYFKW